MGHPARPDVKGLTGSMTENLVVEVPVQFGFHLQRLPLENLDEGVATEVRSDPVEP
jgi:hypothetical protein